MAITKKSTLEISFLSFDITYILIKRAEAVDWIIKYFIILSFIFFFLFKEEVTETEQKAKVFNSSRIQIETHEFLNRHNIEDAIRAIMINKLVLIFYFKLQI